ncbi:MAG TPA: membrane-associated phospholipid phosphatase [Janthinobacterium sp.]|nr:membrane-associated phospholipid phosphatase [Janthinobacterium sp.]
MAVMAPTGVAIALWLAAGKCWRLALNWCLLFGGGMAVVVLTKVAFIGWGIGVSSVELAGFSGHAMRAAAIFPVAFFVLLKNAGPRARVAGVAAGVVLAVLIAIARVVVHAHSVSEVVTGCLLGLAVAFAFIWHARAVREVVVSRVLIALSLCGLLFTPTVEPVPTEQWMQQLALYLSGHERPFQRGDWKVTQRPPSFR